MTFMDQFKKEIDEIEIPKELHDSVKRGVQQAKLENKHHESHSLKSKRKFRPYVVSLLAVVVLMILILPTLQPLQSTQMNNPNEHITNGTIIENENEQKFTDGDSHLTEEIHEIISDYIILQSQDQYEQTDVQFEVHKVYGTLQEGETMTVYLWSFYNRFNRETGNEEVSGASRPITLTLRQTGGKYKVIDYKEPEDGSQFVDSVEKMFPKRYVEQVLQQPSNMEDLKETMQQKVNEWLINENTDTKQYDPKEMERLADTWANALQTRDGKPRYEIMSEKAREKFEEEQIVTSGENWNFVIGVSSPWVSKL